MVLNLMNLKNNLYMLKIKKATKYLLEADILGNGIYRTNEEFKPILADCKFLISLSYYFQLTGKNDFVENEYLSNAIAYCEVSVILNENLSQGYYHLAKYYAYANDCKKLLQNLKKAIEIDRDYSWKWENDKVFEDHKPLIFEFLSNLKEQKRIKAVPLLDKAKHYISKFESKNISQFPNLKAEFNELQHIKGTIALARGMDKNSADSQFYICLTTLSHLDGKNTIFGQVVDGLDVLPKLSKGDRVISIVLNIKN